MVKTILKYLRNTKDQWLVYGESDLKLVGFTNSSFQSDHDDSKSVSGYIFTLNGGAICWKSSKQHIVADSICKAEHMASSDAAKKVVWLRKFITELRVAPSLDGLVLLYYDSTCAITRQRNLLELNPHLSKFDLVLDPMKVPRWSIFNSLADPPVCINKFEGSQSIAALVRMSLNSKNDYFSLDSKAWVAQLNQSDSMISYEGSRISTL